MLLVKSNLETLETVRIALLLPSDYCKADKVIRLVRIMGIPETMIIRDASDAMDAIDSIG